jgi:hypothetical protein
MGAVTDLQAQFKNGRLPLKPGEYRSKAAIFGNPRLLPREKTAGAKLAQAAVAHPKLDFKKSGLKTPASQTGQVGEAPDGFGKYVIWSEKDPQLALVIFLNSGDPMGVGVLGIKPTDRIQFVSSVGHASFSESTENKGVPALIGIAAAGADLTAAAFGFPEVAPLIEAGSKFAKEQFKEKEVKDKIRDPFGEDPGSHDMARQEGGVLVCSPTAHGILSSGTDQELWVKKGKRIDANRPDHVRRAKSFFLRRGMGEQTFAEGGDMFLLAWDFDFSDNFGFYELHVIMKRGSGKVPTPTPVE